jgi:hypothetical protein
MIHITMDAEQFDQLILQRLPTLLRKNSQIQEFVLELARQTFAGRKETDASFYQLLGELKRDREEQSRKWDKYTAEQNRKWDKYTAEQNRKWDEQNRKWDEQNRKWDEQNRKWDEQNRKWGEYTAAQNRKWEEYTAAQNRKWDEQNRKWDDAKLEFDKMHEAIMAIAKKHDRSIGSIGARWGMLAESSFRQALAGILEKSFGVQVQNVTEYDTEGVVFGRPDHIELDVIIHNGLLLICEIKSSMSRSDMYIFERKVRFYEKRHQRQVNRLLVISPMVEARAVEIATQLGIEVYSDSIEVKQL